MFADICSNRRHRVIQFGQLFFFFSGSHSQQVFEKIILKTYIYPVLIVQMSECDIISTREVRQVDGWCLELLFLASIAQPEYIKYVWCHTLRPVSTLCRPYETMCFSR